MPLDANLAPVYGEQPIVRNRTKTAINYWAGYVSSLPIPATKPDPSWVKERILAGMMTTMPENYLTMAFNFYTQDAGIQTAMRDLMDGFPTEAESTNYATVMESSTGAVMSKMAPVLVSNQQVQDWYNANGFAEPPVELTRSKAA